MLKKYFDSLGLKKDDQRKDKSDDKGGSKDDEGFPTVHDCYMIYGGPSMHLTSRQRKERMPGGFCGKDGSATAPQLVEHPHHLQSR